MSESGRVLRGERRTDMTDMTELEGLREQAKVNVVGRAKL